MSEFDELYKNQFFIIDSNKLDNVTSKLYGYLIDGSNFYTNENKDINAKFTGLGAYIDVKNNYDEIIINQDANGCFGIYVYKKDDVFCVSNSFIKLIEYVKNKYPISFNEDTAGALLSYNYSSFIYKQTLINEIELLPRHYVVKIDTASKKIRYELIDYKEKSIDLDSQEAFDILDDWFYRWTSLFRNLKKQTNNITVDLTGGFDSRITFSLVLASNIDLNEVHIRSIKDEVYTHKEDYQIASQIAKEFNFKLNDLSPFDLNRYYFEEKETSFKLSSYVKFGVHNQFFYKYFKNLNPCYSITGYGGENIRHYHGVIPLNKYVENARLASPELVEHTKKIVDYNVTHIKNDFNGTYNDENIEYAISRETVHTYHFGRGTVGKYLINEFGLNPLTDPEINKIKRHDGVHIDENLLIAIIYLRYCPKLLDFEFNGDSDIKTETKEYAKKLNAKYPFNFKGYDLISSNLKNNSKEKLVPKIRVSEIDNHLKDIFTSNGFKKQFESYYPPEVYNYFESLMNSKTYVPLQYARPLLLIMKVLHDVDINNFYEKEDFIDWFNHFLEFGKYKNNEINPSIIKQLLKYNQARIDIINYGQGNDINLVECSDNEGIIKKPSWVKMGGALLLKV